MKSTQKKNQKKKTAMKVTIKKTISYKEASGLKEAVGGWGGYFGFGVAGLEGPKESQRWKDYLNTWRPLVHPYLEAIRQYILLHNIRRGGYWHQEEGCFVFSDGKAGCFSMRGWGDIMAATWSEHENKDYSYLDFAWYTKDEEDNHKNMGS